MISFVKRKFPREMSPQQNSSPKSQTLLEWLTSLSNTSKDMTCSQGGKTLTWSLLEALTQMSAPVAIDPNMNQELWIIQSSKATLPTTNPSMSPPAIIMKAEIKARKSLRNALLLRNIPNRLEPSVFTIRVPYKSILTLVILQEGVPARRDSGIRALSLSISLHSRIRIWKLLACHRLTNRMQLECSQIIFTQILLWIINWIMYSLTLPPRIKLIQRDLLLRPISTK